MSESYLLLFTERMSVSPSFIGLLFQSGRLPEVFRELQPIFDPGKDPMNLEWHAPSQTNQTKQASNQ